MSPVHPLYPTKEHLVPRSRGGGGRTHPGNVVWAHGLCNHKKGDRLLSELPRGWYFGLQGMVKCYLDKHGLHVSKAEMNAARNRVQVHQVRQRLSAQERHLYGLSRWEDDGGAVIPEI